MENPQKKEIAYGFGMLVKDIEPIKPLIMNTKESVKIGIKPVGGELKKNHVFYYAFYSLDGEVQYEGNMLLEGEDYQKWADNDEYPLQCLVRAIPQIVIK